jgi:outer membrane protein assembly factor BamE
MRLPLALLLASSVLLTGCLYRQPILQGNLLESKNVAQLQAGMSKRQVLALLGSPSVADPFRHNRWDYVASQQRGHGDAEVKIFTVHFDGDAVRRWEGEYFPEQDAELSVEMSKFGNLPRDKDKDRRGR